jgi:IclR family acetate operon transcriptional repressor
MTDSPKATESGDAAQRKGPEGLRALDRAVSILYALAAHPSGISLAELSRETGLTVSTVHRMLAALRTKALARETVGGLHGLGLGTLVLSGAYLQGLDLRAEARPYLERLNRETNETVHLGAFASPHIVYIDKIDSTRPVQIRSRVGATMPAVRTALGKIILASSSEQQIETTFAETRQQLGDIFDAESLRVELATAQRQGYGLDLEENERGVCCVGAAVRDNAGRVVAAISVTTPTDRFDMNDVAGFGARIRQAADDISASLGYLSPQRILELKTAGTSREHGTE